LITGRQKKNVRRVRDIVSGGARAVGGADCALNHRHLLQ